MKGLAVLLGAVAFLSQGSVIAQPSATSTNQSGGVTAGSIGVLNQIPERDILRDRLASTMVRHNRLTGDTIRTANETPLFSALVNTNEAPFRAPDGNPILYTFIAERDLFPSVNDAAKCAIPRGVSVRGMRASPRLDGGRAVATGAFLPANDPLLRAVCNSLSQPSNWLRGAASQLLPSGQPNLTVYDLLIGSSSQPLVVALMPGFQNGRRLDAVLSRTYWVSAFASDYFGENYFQANPKDDPQLFEQSASILRGDRFEFGRPIPPGLESAYDFDKPFPAEKLKQFGGRLEALDKLWLEYLRASTVTLDNVQRDIMQGGGYNEILPIFSADQISSPDFWRRIYWMKDYLTQINCIGARFAVEHVYAAATDLPSYGQCPIWRIRRQ